MYCELTLTLVQVSGLPPVTLRWRWSNLFGWPSLHIQESPLPGTAWARLRVLKESLEVRVGPSFSGTARLFSVDFWIFGRDPKRHECSACDITIMRKDRNGYLNIALLWLKTPASPMQCTHWTSLGHLDAPLTTTYKVVVSPTYPSPHWGSKIYHSRHREFSCTFKQPDNAWWCSGVLDAQAVSSQLSVCVCGKNVNHSYPVQQACLTKPVRIDELLLSDRKVMEKGIIFPPSSQLGAFVLVNHFRGIALISDSAISGVS